MKSVFVYAPIAMLLLAFGLAGGWPIGALLSCILAVVGMSILDVQLHKATRSALVLEELRQQDQHSWRNIFEKAFEAMLVVNEQGIVVASNPAANTLLKFSDADLIGHNLRFLFPEAFLSQHQNDPISEFTRWQKSGSPSELDLLCKDGSLKTAEITVTEVFRDGIKMFVGILRDVKHRLQIERVQMELKAHAEFVAAITHEVRAFCSPVSDCSLTLCAAQMRAPLNAVVAVTRLLADTSLTAEQREFVQTVRSGGDTLLTFVNDFLDLSRLEAHKLRLDLADFDLHEVAGSFSHFWISLFF
jgi:PAS domain S-box-containing protein